MLLFEELIGKKIVVFKADGFKKYGKLLEVNPLVIKLEYVDGNVEYISLGVIASISQDRRVE